MLGAAARKYGPSCFALLVTACRGRPVAPPPKAADLLDRALSPAGFARALGAAKGGHFTATTSFRVAREGTSGPAAERAAVKTTTDLVVAPNGDFRLVEDNDRDGGREVILSGKDLAVAIRPGKLIKRPAQAQEATRFLEEALGGPGAVWELARRAAKIEVATSQGGTTYKLSLAPTLVDLAEPASPGPLAGWRKAAKVQALAGEIELGASDQLLRHARLEVRFSVVQDSTAAVGATAVSATTVGVATVDARLANVGGAGPVAPPVADEVHPRQRTILEERALLGQRLTAGPVPPARSR